MKNIKKSKKPIAKKVLAKKQNKMIKTIGYFAVSVSLVALVVFMAVSLASTILPSASINEDVLGSTTDTMAPTSFGTVVKNYRVSLVWDNMVDGEYQYLIWVYDTTSRKYTPKAFGMGEAGIGTTVTYDLDQVPGTSVLYRVSSCKDCKFAKDGSVIGKTGVLSAGIVARVARIVAPTAVSAMADDSGINLAWKQIAGVDGYDIWRTTNLFGFTGYSKIGSVGTLGTFSSYHINNLDGTPKIPTDIASPTSYLDKRVEPGKRYYYRVSAKKMIMPLAKSTKWVSVSGGRSATVSAVAE